MINKKSLFDEINNMKVPLVCQPDEITRYATDPGEPSISGE